VLIRSDRLAPRRSAGAVGRALWPCALLASIGALAFALGGCGGGSHSGAAAADVNGAPAQGASATGATATSTGTSTTTAPRAGGKASGGSLGGGSAAGSGGTGGGTAGGGASGGGSRASSGGGSGSRGGSGSAGGAGSKHGAHGHAKATGGSGAGGAGAVGAGTNAGSGAAGSSGAGAPSASTGIPYEIETSSMEPTFQPETKIYYDPTRTHPQIGEVVVFYLPAGAEEGACGEALIGGRACTDPLPGTTKAKLTSFKRIVGLPGDSIAIRDGRVIRDGQPESEPPILPCGKDEKTECEFPTPITVPAGHYYVMADNRGLAKEDSRIFGAVPQEYILGTVEGG
jgi:signal peptidase I